MCPPLLEFDADLGQERRYLIQFLEHQLLQAYFVNWDHAIFTLLPLHGR